MGVSPGPGLLAWGTALPSFGVPSTALAPASLLAAWSNDRPFIPNAAPSSLLLLFAFSLFSPSLSSVAVAFFGADQHGNDQTWPVKLLTVNPPFCHLRQGLPDRSRARRPALMAPWLALGPSLWEAGPAGVVQGCVLSLPSLSVCQ